MPDRRRPRVPPVAPVVLPRPPGRPVAPAPVTVARTAPRPRPPAAPRPPVATRPIAPATRPAIGITTPLPLPAAEPPPNLGSKELADWHVAQVHAHERLRTLSFYDTGRHLMKLLEMREHFAARDIKELCSKVDLGMSHMTANKYLQVARSFDRAAALGQGIEKCYALTVYAKAIGRPGQAAAILASDEPVRGAPGLRASSASASKLYAAVRALKEAAREGREPTEIQAARARTAKATATLVRRLGMRGAQVEIVRRGGEARVAIYLSLEDADGLAPSVVAKLPRFAPWLARTRPELVAPLRAAGWKLRGSG